MKTILIIEDSLERNKQFFQNFENVEIHTALSVEFAIGMIKNNDKYDMIFFDHDLRKGGDAIDVAKWLSNHKNKIPNNIYIHSSNPVGAQNIKGYLKYARIAPMIWKQKIDFSKL
jgi:DNA-binding NtrC family response regulator